MIMGNYVENHQNLIRVDGGGGDEEEGNDAEVNMRNLKL